MRHTISAALRPGEDSGYVAECAELSVVTQGATLDEAVENLREVVALALEDAHATALDLAPEPVIVVSFELSPLARF
ncbi:MAG: type II toxin-antitoxin system HicB family antitoxin [Tepidiformaceae bacterium]